MMVFALVVFPISVRLLRWYICRRYFREAPQQQQMGPIRSTTLSRKDRSSPLNSPTPLMNPRRQSSPASYSYSSPTEDEDIIWLRTLPGDTDSRKEALTAEDLAHEVPIMDDDLLD